MAVMWTVIIKNSSGSTKTVEDLGISIADSSQVTFSDQFTFDTIAGSDSLRTLVQAGDLVVNDGTSDLSAANGVKYLTLNQNKYLADNHYTKTELQTSGQSEVHWDNISNAPSFGSPRWLGPVLYRVTQIASGKDPSPSTGTVCVDTDDDHYYKYNGVSWDDLGAVANGDRIIKLDEADEAIFVYVVDTWTDQGAPEDNDAVMVNDDGDAKQAQYVYEIADTSWKKIADVDFSGHLDSGASKHDADQIDVEGTYTNISGTPTDLESTISAIDTALGTALDHNTLDEAYDEGGAGAGRTINVTDGAVKLDTGAATNAPLELTEKASLPSTGLGAGQLAVKGGILCIYDSTRSKWLSVQRMFISFGRSGNTKDQYLNFFGGNLASNNAGLRMARNATIVSITAQFDSSGTGTAHIRKNDVATNIASLTVTAALGNQATDTNVDVSAGDYLQSYLEATSACTDPMVVIEIAWRP